MVYYTKVGDAREFIYKGNKYTIPVSTYGQPKGLLINGKEIDRNFLIRFDVENAEDAIWVGENKYFDSDFYKQDTQPIQVVNGSEAQKIMSGETISQQVVKPCVEEKDPLDKKTIFIVVGVAAIVYLMFSKK